MSADIGLCYCSRGVVTITCCGEGLDHSEPDMLRLCTMKEGHQYRGLAAAKPAMAHQ